MSSSLLLLLLVGTTYGVTVNLRFKNTICTTPPCHPPGTCPDSRTGEYRPRGARWKEGCARCECTKHGYIRCDESLCGVLTLKFSMCLPDLSIELLTHLDYQPLAQYIQGDSPRSISWVPGTVDTQSGCIDDGHLYGVSPRQLRRIRDIMMGTAGFDTKITNFHAEVVFSSVLDCEDDEYFTLEGGCDKCPPGTPNKKGRLYCVGYEPSDGDGIAAEDCNVEAYNMCLQSFMNSTGHTRPAKYFLQGNMLQETSNSLPDFGPMTDPISQTQTTGGEFLSGMNPAMIKTQFCMSAQKGYECGRTYGCTARARISCQQGIALVPMQIAGLEECCQADDDDNTSVPADADDTSSPALCDKPGFDQCVQDEYDALDTIGSGNDSPCAIVQAIAECGMTYHCYEDGVQQCEVAKTLAITNFGVQFDPKCSCDKEKPPKPDDDHCGAGDDCPECHDAAACTSHGCVWEGTVCFESGPDDTVDPNTSTCDLFKANTCQNDFISCVELANPVQIKQCEEICNSCFGDAECPVGEGQCVDDTNDTPDLGICGPATNCGFCDTQASCEQQQGGCEWKPDSDTCWWPDEDTTGNPMETCGGTLNCEHCTDEAACLQHSCEWSVDSCVSGTTDIEPLPTTCGGTVDCQYCDDQAACQQESGCVWELDICIFPGPIDSDPPSTTCGGAAACKYCLEEECLQHEGCELESVVPGTGVCFFPEATDPNDDSHECNAHVEECEIQFDSCMATPTDLLPTECRCTLEFERCVQSSFAPCLSYPKTRDFCNIYGPNQVCGFNCEQFNGLELSTLSSTEIADAFIHPDDPTRDSLGFAAIFPLETILAGAAISCECVLGEDLVTILTQFKFKLDLEKAN